MGISISNLRPSSAIIYNKELYTIVKCEHSKLARGAAFCRTKLKNMRTGSVREVTLRDSDDIQQAFIEQRKLQFLYSEGSILHFMDLESYQDFILSADAVAQYQGLFKDNLELTGLFYQDELINLILPKTVDLKVTETEPGVQGDTVKSANKPATLETGLKISVPLFVKSGMIIKVDTENKEYAGKL